MLARRLPIARDRFEVHCKCGKVWTLNEAERGIMDEDCGDKGHQLYFAARYPNGEIEQESDDSSEGSPETEWESDGDGQGGEEGVGG